MKKLFFFIIFVFIPICMIAQTFTLKGKVIDEEGKPVEFASVSCVTQGKATVTSLKGEYNLTLHSADSVVIR